MENLDLFCPYRSENTAFSYSVTIFEQAQLFNLNKLYETDSNRGHRSEKGTKRYEETENKDFETLGHKRIPKQNSAFGEHEGLEKTGVPRDREDGDIVTKDHPSEVIAKDNISAKNHEAKLRTVSDTEC